MKLLIDASALLNIIKLKGGSAVEYLKGSYALTLTPYEVGNSLWKEAIILKRISAEDALALLGYVSQVYKMMQLLEPNDLVSVLRLACELETTYYDSAYVVASVENDLALVTDDRKLAEKVREKRMDVKRLLGKEPRCLSSTDVLSQPPYSLT